VRLRVYEKARDWQHIEESRFALQSEYRIAADALQIIDPKNFRPVHEYTPNVLETEDLEDMKECGYVITTCVIAISSHFHDLVTIHDDNFLLRANVCATCVYYVYYGDGRKRQYDTTIRGR
jgi:hypothetical protein